MMLCVLSAGSEAACQHAMPSVRPAPLPSEMNLPLEVAVHKHCVTMPWDWLHSVRAVMPPQVAMPSRKGSQVERYDSSYRQHE
jgi:hypothetical protein